MEFEKYRLSQLLTIKNGRDYKSLGQGSVPVFGSGGYMCSVDSYLYDRPSVLLPRKGTLSNIQYYNKGPFWTVDTCYYTIVNENLVDSYYVYRYLRNLNLSGLDTGASIPSMTQKTYNGIKILLPNLSIQHRIASILSTYDSLIENNTKRIRLLEKMAENLYKEWFSYGKIIKGGTIVRLTDIIQITRGLSYSTAEIDCEEGLDLINLKNIQAYGGFRYDGTKKFCGKYKNEQIVCEGDLVMGVTDMTQDRRTVGSVALIPKTDKLSVISADLIKISSSISSVFLFGMFKYGNVSKYVAQFANGANVLHLRPKALHNIKVLLPNPNLINKYVDIVSPMVAEMNKLYVLSEKLARQRDLLLPRLMSGKLEVKEELLE